MNALVRFFLSLVAVVFIHVVAVRFVADLARYLDVFLLLTAVYALRGVPATGMLAGTVAGLVQDAYSSSGIYGLNAFAKTVVGFLLATVASRFVIRNVFTRVAAVFVAALVNDTVILLLNRFLGQFRIEGESPFLRALATALLAAAVFELQSYFERRRVAHDESRLVRRVP